MRLVRSVVLALTLLSCTAEDRVGPSRPPAPQAAIQAAAALPVVRISEIHYDNTGTDAGEAIEVSGPAGTDLIGWTIVLYNGSNALVYDTDPLSGPIADQCDGRGTVVLNYPVNGIQNGGPDGVVLLDPSGTVVEFLSYEGAFTAIGGPADGMLSIDIGVREVGNELLGLSLQRTASGAWYGPATASFGACNVEPVVARVAVSPPAATVVQGSSQQFTAGVFTAANQPIAGVSVSWSSTAPTIAEVSATGLAAGLAPGDAGIVATAPNGVADTAEVRVNEPPPEGDLPETRFSEIHYDNDGTDIAEAIEVEGPAGADLNGWRVVLYNGTGGRAYDTRALEGTIVERCGGRGVVRLTYTSNGIQNGGPDGLALVNAAGAVVEFLSYEGTFTAADGPAAGLTSTDIGVAEGSSTALGRSLQRLGTGAWQPPAHATFGACNEGDTGPPPPPVLTLILSGRVAADPPLPVGFQDQLFASLVDATRTEVPTAFTWRSETPGVASVDQDGVVTALGAGTAIFRATGDEGSSATTSLPMRVAVASATAQYAGNAEFGEPADGDASDDFIVRRAQYTASYNPTRGTPNWVSYNLDATHFGSEDRCDCFTFDPALPAAFTRYTTADYTGAGEFHGFGIDRGHLARSFDRTAGSLDNATTFYFTNIVPQAADLNQGPWAALEIHLGDLARFANREVYIIAGVAGSKGTVKDEGLIVIPAATWKVAVIMPRDHGLADIHSYQDLELIAVIMPNDPGVRNVDWTTYRATVNAIELVSGYDVLASLPDDIEMTVESGIDKVQTLVDGLVADGTLERDSATSLTAMLRAAARQLDRGNVTAGANQLRSFLNEVDALVRSARLTAAQAAPLRTAAAEIIAGARSTEDL